MTNEGLFANEIAILELQDEIAHLQKRIEDLRGQKPVFHKGNKQDPLTKGVGILQLHEKTHNALINAKIFTIGHLIEYRDSKLFLALGNDEVMLDEIQFALSRKGLRLS